MINDDKCKFKQVVSVELFEALKTSQNLLSSISQIGSIHPIAVNIPGVTIDSDIWQECNGSTINNPDSPLCGKQTPDLRDRFIRLDSPGVSGNAWGQNEHTYQWQHQHGIVTGDATYTDSAETDEDYYPALASHSHIIGNAVFTSGPAIHVMDLRPPYIEIKFYMRIL